MAGRSASERPTWLQRIGWLLLIWTAGVLSLGLAALALRMLMTAAGMTA
jgi:hypothetical protein